MWINRLDAGHYPFATVPTKLDKISHKRRNTGQRENKLREIGFLFSIRYEKIKGTQDKKQAEILHMILQKLCTNIA